MINDNTLEYLTSLLEDHEALSDYSLEYSMALFMNFSLKSSGLKKCVNDQKRIIKFSCDLLANSNFEVNFGTNQKFF